MAGSEAGSTDHSRNLTNRSIDNGETPLPLDLEYYDMSKERKMIIFNHKDYKEDYPELKRKPALRNHTEKDVCALKNTFENLNFDVKDYDDEKHDDILSIVKKLCDEAGQDHTRTSCVCVCVLTHGAGAGKVCAYDEMYELSELITLLQTAPGLVGKPKLVIVQACRGGLADSGIQVDGPNNAAWLPTHADTLVLTSTVEDFKSYRNGRGSWLIQELCRVVGAKHRDLDVLQMTTLVTALVAKRVTNSKYVKNHNKKQTPETRSTLTKTLVFHSPRYSRQSLSH